ncbi:MAG: hypothetical protein LBJ35_04395 [Spirochaetaceae bacterium]|nr:hypothetical protein [Spirochaetaceae bacterium]
MFCGILPLAAQNFKPYSILRVLSTEHFEFIYPEASAVTAKKLASRADAIYDKVSALTGLALDRKVPVIITPETDEHNGYMNPLPYPHIAIFDTPASIEWTVFTNSLEALFLHEMTHAVTGATRGTVDEILYRIFGGWVYPAGLNAPWFMIEGAAVSFESLDGTGRSNDPLIKQKLRQDVLENNFKTPFQAEGVWDMPPLGNTYYYYGGLFSSYLQKEYGMEKYGELWREIGEHFHASLIFYNSGFYNIFKRVYGISIIECWNNFKESFVLDGVKENTSGLVYGGKSSIKDIAAADKKIFFIDSLAGKILVYNTETKKTKTVIPADSAAYAIDVSADGKRMLVSTYQRFGANAGQFSRAIVIEYNASNGFRTGREWKGLYNARYFRDGVIALNSDTHIMNLVYRRGNDKNGKDEEILLRGSETLLFSNPSPIDDEWAAFTSAKYGVRELSLFNYKTRAVYTLRGDIADDADTWRYMRGLRFSDGRLYFSYNDDDRMYKFASVSINDLPDGGDGSCAGAAAAYFSGADFSGGVFQPVSSGGRIYYRASFSMWDAVLEYPDIQPEFENENTEYALNMIPWESDWIITEDVYNKIDTAPLPPEKLYNPIKYFNPFNLWIPFPIVSPIVNSVFWDGENAISASGDFKNLRLDGAGFFSYISDPMDQNLIFLGAGYDFYYNTAPLNITWINFSFMAPIIADFSDVVVTNSESLDIPTRKTRASVQASYRIPLGNERLSLTVFGMLSGAWYFFDYTDSEESAYNWPLQQETYDVLYGFRISNLMLASWERFGNGFLNQLYVINSLFTKDVYPRFENIFRMSAESIRLLQNIPAMNNFAFQLSLYGVYDKHGINYLGHSRSYSNSIFDGVGAYEYAAKQYTYNYQWLTGGEFEWSPVSFEIQKNLSHLYFNRIFAGLGYRWVYLGDEDTSRKVYLSIADDRRLLHSVIFRMSAVTSIVPVTVLPVKITFNLIGALKLSEMENGFSGDSWYLGWGFSLSY